MPTLDWTTDDPARPMADTPFGRYRAGFDNYAVLSDVPINETFVTVYWAYLDDHLLYRGFSVNGAFDAAEHDYEFKMSGSLERAA